MALSFAGNGTITGLSVGGLPDGTVDGDTLASGTGGKVLQVVNVQNSTLSTTTSQIPFDNTTPQNTEGLEVMTLAVTPAFASNKLLISVNTWLSPSSADWALMALFQDSTANALAVGGIGYVTTATGGGMSNLHYYMSANTTSATTFKVRVGSRNGVTVSFNGQGGSALFSGTLVSSMTITEISA